MLLLTIRVTAKQFVAEFILFLLLLNKFSKQFL